MAKIVNITEAVSIALHAMIIVAKREGQINVNEITAETNSSKFHIAKIMQKLVKDGFLVSHRGPSGGFLLAKPAESITLLEIYESIEGKIVVSRCPLGKATCPFGRCIFDDLTMKMTHDFKDYLAARNLEDYKKKHRGV
jgi:Rrf2 family protein